MIQFRKSKKTISIRAALERHAPDDLIEMKKAVALARRKHALSKAAPEMFCEIKNLVGAYKNYLRKEIPQPAREQVSIFIGRLESIIAKIEDEL